MVFDRDTRIYGDKIDIDYSSARNFWNSRAKTDNSIKSVLLGTKFSKNSGVLRNKKELSILLSCLNSSKKYDILDIGCGNGRWCNNLRKNIKIYHGIDYSNEFIKSNQSNFSEFDNYKFFNMSITDIDISKLFNKYDLLIATGVLMYVNDNDIKSFFNLINNINPTFIYMQESVSIMPTRLTLKDFDSEELKTEYSAIYRTLDEYKNYILSLMSSYKINKTGLLLDKQTGAREETNASYWFLERINHDKK